MQKISTLTLVLSLILIISFGQNTINCNTSISYQQFQQKKSYILSKPTDIQKLALAKQIATNNCMLSVYVKEIAEFFMNDANRLNFTMAAYPTTVDKENFYVVYDAFAYFSNAFRLHDFVLGYQNHIISDEDYMPPPVSFQFPVYNYPNYINYQGHIGCNLPIAENDFMVLAIEVVHQNSDITRMNIISQLAQNNCFTVSQLMKLTSLLQMENNRLNILKNCFWQTFDLDNFEAATQLFTHLPYKNDLIAYIKSQLAPNNNTPPPPPPCMIPSEEISQITQIIKKESFENTKITLAKQIISSKKCFTSMQIKDIIKLFGFESSKLEIAKFAYDFTVDKQNYYIINDVFSFSSSKKELNNYIGSKQ